MARHIAVLLVLLAVLIVFFGVQADNRLVGLDEEMNGKWARIETVLQQRYDLIPNLVNAIEGNAAQERGLFEEINLHCSQWNAAKTVDAKVVVAGQIEGALARLLAVAENNPGFKADRNLSALRDELAETEKSIDVECRRFNEAVREYNVAIRRFPTNFFAGLLGFRGNKAYFGTVAASKPLQP